MRFQRIGLESKCAVSAYRTPSIHGQTWKTPGAAREAIFFTPGGPLLASEQPKLARRDGRGRGSKYQAACRRRVVEAGPRNLDLLQLAE